MSQDPSSQSRYPPRGGFYPGPPSSQFLEAQTLPTELPGKGWQGRVWAPNFGGASPGFEPGPHEWFCCLVYEWFFNVFQSI